MVAADTTRFEKLLQQIADDDPTVAIADVRDFSSKCDSPIEQLFAAAYLAVIFEGGCHFQQAFHWGAGKVFDRYMSDAYREIPHHPFLSYRADIVAPQLQVEGCRVDFAILRFEEDEGEEAPVLKRRPLVVVECDGHEFHERTPAQAERDRSRDRAFQAAGHVVFRFTGRELYRDPMACARQVDDFFDNLWRRPRT